MQSPSSIIRNLDPSKGLANGTRLVVKACLRRTVQCTIATGSHVVKEISLDYDWLPPT